MREIRKTGKQNQNKKKWRGRKTGSKNKNRIGRKNKKTDKKKNKNKKHNIERKINKKQRKKIKTYSAKKVRKEIWTRWKQRGTKTGNTGNRIWCTLDCLTAAWGEHVCGCLAEIKRKQEDGRFVRREEKEGKVAGLCIRAEE